MTSRINTTDFDVGYTEPGDSNSPLEEGGYVIDYPDTQAEALATNYTVNQDYLSVDWGVFILEFIYISPNTKRDFYAHNYIKFSRSSAGLITQKYEMLVSRNMYLNPIDQFRGFLEICWIILK